MDATRSCKLCPARMSTLKYDRHTLCTVCRGNECDLGNRCEECRDWTDDEVVQLLKHRKSLEQKRRAKKVSKKTKPLPRPVPAPSVDIEERLSAFQTKMSDDVQSLLSNFMSQFRQELQHPTSIHTSSDIHPHMEVPGMAVDAAAAGGPSAHDVSGTGRSRSPGVAPPCTIPPSSISFQSSGVLGRQLGGRRPPISPGSQGFGSLGELGDGLIGQQQGHAPPNYPSSEGIVPSGELLDVSIQPSVFSPNSLLNPSARGSVVPPSLTPPLTFSRPSSSAVSSAASSLLLAPVPSSSRLSSLSLSVPSHTPVPTLPLSSGFSSVATGAPLASTMPPPGFPSLVSSSRPISSTLPLSLSGPSAPGTQVPLSSAPAPSSLPPSALPYASVYAYASDLGLPFEYTDLVRKCFLAGLLDVADIVKANFPQFFHFMLIDYAGTSSSTLLPLFASVSVPGPQAPVGPPLVPARAPGPSLPLSVPSLPPGSSSVPPRPSVPPLGPSVSSLPPLSSGAPSAPPVSPSSVFVIPDFTFPSQAGDVPCDDDDQGSSGAVPMAVPASSLTEFRRMVSFINEFFPASKGPEPSPAPRCVFETLYSSSPLPEVGAPKFAWFDRVQQSLQAADTRLLKQMRALKADTSLLPLHHAMYAVPGNPSRGRAVPVNPNFTALLTRVPPVSCTLAMTLKEAEGIESAVRHLSELQSFSMWVLSGLIGYLKALNFSPSDEQFFDQLVTSLSKGLVHQTTIAASLTTFIATKRRRQYLSFLQSFFLDHQKRSLLESPITLVPYLFDEASVSRLVEWSNTTSSLQSQQALVDVASKASGKSSSSSSSSRSRAPKSSSSSSSSKKSSPSRSRSRSRSPSGSSKRLKFGDSNPRSILKSPPAKPKSGKSTFAK